MLKEPLISIILNINENTQHLEKCLKTLTFQMYENIEIICVESNISNETSEIINSYAQKDTRIKRFPQNNTCSSSARNFGILLSMGEYISFANPDDWAMLDLYQVFVNSLNSVDDLDVYIFNTSFYSDKFEDIPGYEFFAEEDILNNDINNTPHTFKDIRNLLTKNFFITNKIYKKQFLEENNIRFVDEKIASDYLFNVQTLIKAKNIIITPEAYCRHRFNQHIEGSDTEKVFDIFYINHEIFNFLSKENLMNYYLMEFFNFMCNSYPSYYKICPENLKYNYFETMRNDLLGFYNIMPQGAKDFLKNIKEAEFMLNSSFEEFKEKYSDND